MAAAEREPLRTASCLRNNRPQASWRAPDWKGAENVRAFGQASSEGIRSGRHVLRRRPGNRRAALIELIHEEMEFRIKAGEPSGLEANLERFAEIAADLHLCVADLVAAESALRRHATSELPEGSNDPRENVAGHSSQFASAGTNWAM